MTTKAELFTNIAAALRDFRTYSVANQLYIDQFEFWQNLDITCYTYYDLIIGAEGLAVQVRIPWRSANYYTLIDHKEVQLSYDNCISVTNKLRRKLSTGLKISSFVETTAAIPDKEMNTLRLLGKVETTLTKASINESVFCPN